jgi:hypothetical protein
MPNQKKRSTSWPPHEMAPPEYLRALGSIVSNFNGLEIAFLYLFHLYVELPEEAVAYIFHKLDNTARLDIFKRCVDGSGEPKKIISSLHHFVRCFGVCAENRNILMHSHPLVLYENNKLIVLFTKAARKTPGEWNSYRPTLRELRALALAVHKITRYGYSLYTFILRTTSVESAHIKPWPAWPKRPALPKLLSPEFR